ncbi:TenA family transcriptional regulator [Kitasatospora sp. NPDC050543]|uniref:TenA family transcriptional regulator n=1 Tax=Kitasatospora sp. NPDC050543 TaxID=3364054 RepID=UPI0037B2AA1D
MSNQEFIDELDAMIAERRKMTSPLYQTILGGKATQRLLQGFAIHRWPIKNLWVRHLLGVAHRLEDHRMRVLFVENAFEEETGRLSDSRRHVESFADFARSVGVTREELENTPFLPETQELHDNNLRLCNSDLHFTAGAAGVLLLMEGQPPIVNAAGESMLKVMRDEYLLPDWGYDFFVHHASSDASEAAVSELEDEHSAAVRTILREFCTTPELRDLARTSLAHSIELRHRHFDALMRDYYDPSEPVFRYQGEQ